MIIDLYYIYNIYNIHIGKVRQLNIVIGASIVKPKLSARYSWYLYRVGRSLGIFG